jgi:hypothetical protein
MSRRDMIMDFEKIEARNDCVGEDQEQFNRLTVFKGLNVRLCRNMIGDEYRSAI